MGMAEDNAEDDADETLRTKSAWTTPGLRGRNFKVQDNIKQRRKIFKARAIYWTWKDNAPFIMFGKDSF